MTHSSMRVWNQMTKLWPIERRVLAYLDQHGPTHRSYVVFALARDDSRIGSRRDRGKIGGGGSNAGVPLIMGACTRRLQKWVGFGKSVIVRAITAITKSL